MQGIIKDSWEKDRSKLGNTIFIFKNLWDLFRKMKNKTTSEQSVEGSLWLTIEIFTNIHTSFDLEQIITSH